MADRALSRLRDVKISIGEIRSLLAGKTFEDMSANNVTRAAFERFLEIPSEASRHIPDEWRAETADEVPWRQIADLGNKIRHEYHQIDAKVLWSIYEDDLSPLERSVDAILARHAK